MPWTIVILIGGLIPMSTAIQQSGAADEMARVLVDLVGEDSPYLLLIAIFVLVASLGAVVSNVATALIVAPIAVRSCRCRCLGPTRTHGRGSRGKRQFPHPDLDPGEHDGDGPGRLPVW